MIETDRLILREFGKEDLDELHEVLSNARVMRFSATGPFSREQTSEFIDRCRKTYCEKGFGMYAVMEKKRNRIIGCCGFFFQVIDGMDEVEIGYRLHPDFWNQGLGTEAARAVQDYGFGPLGLKRLISIIEAENVPSIRVAEKNGLRHEKDSVHKGIPVRIYAIESGKGEVTG